MDNRTDAFAFMHQVKRPVDVFERHSVGDAFVDLDFAVHVLLDHTG